MANLTEMGTVGLKSIQTFNFGTFYRAIDYISTGLKGLFSHQSTHNIPNKTHVLIVLTNSLKSKTPLAATAALSLLG